MLLLSDKLLKHTVRWKRPAASDRCSASFQVNRELAETRALTPSHCNKIKWNKAAEKKTKNITENPPGQQWQ